MGKYPSSSAIGVPTCAQELLGKEFDFEKFSSRSPLLVFQSVVCCGKRHFSGTRADQFRRTEGNLAIAGPTGLVAIVEYWLISRLTLRLRDKTRSDGGRYHSRLEIDTEKGLGSANGWDEFFSVLRSTRVFRQLSGCVAGCEATMKRPTKWERLRERCARVGHDRPARPSGLAIGPMEAPVGSGRCSGGHEPLERRQYGDPAVPAPPHRRRGPRDQPRPNGGGPHRGRRLLPGHHRRGLPRPRVHERPAAVPGRDGPVPASTRICMYGSLPT